MDYYSSLDPRSLTNTPTIFEIISTDELQRLITPSLKFFIINIIQKYPNKFNLQIALKFDELNLIIRSLVEYLNFKNDNSSFVEKFYGLKKICKINVKSIDSNIELNNDNDQEFKLNQLQIIISIFKITGLEYLNEKFSNWYNQLYSKILLKTFKIDQNLSWIEYLKYLLIIQIIPSIKNFYSTINVLFKILYLSRLTNSIDLIDYIFKIDTTRIIPNQTLSSSSISEFKIFKKPSFQQNINHLFKLNQIKSIIKSSLQNLLPFTIFLLKFLEWYNSSDFIKKIKSNSSNIPNIPPPILRNFPITTKKNCPICREQITNAAILETGYVFCYPCIYNYLLESDDERCPITGLQLLHVKKIGQGRKKIEGLRKLIL
ncbi:hypothetical protein WICMUC_004874 [Wickerhamomyces mucosus]|uniref:Peroxisome assembly protein 12 n=1 Tax=Wickerhamomyces mucosus TaxID=1378264 RepID=A0A9P8PEQ6_9ASCO|nr:hypothetical protein WICMUC_004874 [Wickerhamomyces mucosus]